MIIKYELGSQYYFYKLEDAKEMGKLNFILSNNKGDFLNLGYYSNVTKFQGYNVCNAKTLNVFKFVDEILPEGVECKKVGYGGYYASRKYASKVTENLEVSNEEEEKSKDGKNSSVYDETSSLLTKDRFYLGPTGGFVYEIYDYEGKVCIDLDMREQNDFDEWGRIYDVYEENGIVYVEFTKYEGEVEEDKLFLGVKAVNFSYDLIKDFVKKEY